MNLLFICKHNRFRSKVAEALFKTYTSKHETKSAGLILDLTRPYVCKNVKLALEEHNIFNINETARLTNEQDQQWADKIVIVANNIDPNLFPKEKTIIWSTDDADESEAEKIKAIVSQINERMKQLIQELHL